MFGSGTDSDPVSPWISIGEALLLTLSKLVVSVDSAPFACSRMPVTWVSTSTGIRSPARGPEPMTRSLRSRLADPTTAVTGPSRWTSAEM